MANCEFVLLLMCTAMVGGVTDMVSDVGQESQEDQPDWHLLDMVPVLADNVAELTEQVRSLVDRHVELAAHLDRMNDQLQTCIAGSTGGRPTDAPQPGQVRPCPANFELDSTNHFCFKLLTDRSNWAQSWTEAQSKCEQLGSGVHLATLDTPRKFDLAVQYINDTLKCRMSSVYIGGRQAENEGPWYWAETYEGFSDEINTRWVIGEPNDYGGDEDCGMLSMTRGEDDNEDCTWKLADVACGDDRWMHMSLCDMYMYNDVHA